MATALAALSLTMAKQTKKRRRLVSRKRNMISAPLNKAATQNLPLYSRIPGKEDLVISNVQTSCGCTIPDWTRGTIGKRKNESCECRSIAYAGKFIKSITVYSNAVTWPVTFKIKGKVVPKSVDQKKK